MNPANYREALIETAADEAEGADILLVMLLLYIIGGLLQRWNDVLV
jgi:porphobilinogen synthase